MSKTIVRYVANLPPGVSRIRGVVNPEPRKAILGESDFSDNISQERTQTYLLPVATVQFETDQAVIRYGETAGLTWRIDTDYKLTCEISGPMSEEKSKLNPPIGITDNKTSPRQSLPLTSEQTFTLTCTPESGAGVPPDVIIRSVTVEVIPRVQEI